MKTEFRISKVADAENILSGFRQIWKVIKDATGTSQRLPKTIAFTDTPAPVILNDGEMGRRFAPSRHHGD